MPKQYGPRKAGFSVDEVREFMCTFPCSGLRERAYWFEFDHNGDLVDTDVPEQDDGPGAAALAQDAQEFLREQEGGMSAHRWRVHLGRFLVDANPDGSIPLNARIHAEFKVEPVPSVRALIDAAPELLAMVQRGAELEGDPVAYRHACARLAARVTGEA